MLLESRIDNDWIVDVGREPSGPGTRFTHFIILNEQPPRGYTESWGRLTKFKQHPGPTMYSWPEVTDGSMDWSVDGQMDVWINWWIDRWMDQSINWWIDRWRDWSFHWLVKKKKVAWSIDEFMKDWLMDGWVDRSMGGLISRWKIGWLKNWFMDGRITKFINGFIDREIVRWIGGLIDECL